MLFGMMARLMDVKTVIFVPRTNLLSQTVDQLTKIVGIPGDQIGIVGGGKNDIGKNKKILVVTYQGHISKMKSSEAYRREIGECELVICDEAHRSLGEMTQKHLKRSEEEDKEVFGEFDDRMTTAEENAENTVLKDLKKYVPKEALTLGFTATPKLEKKDVSDTFKNLIASETHNDMVKAGILVRYKFVHTKGELDWESMQHKLTEEEEAEMLQEKGAYTKLLTAFKKTQKEIQKSEKRRLRPVAFCVNIKACDDFVIAAENIGLKCRIVTSREASKAGKNVDIIKEAEEALLKGGRRKGGIDIIVSVDKLTEGWDFPRADAAIIARASQSPARVIQGAGRTARSYPGKEYSIIFETNWKISEKAIRDKIESIKKKYKKKDPDGTDKKSEEKKDKEIDEVLDGMMSVIGTHTVAAAMAESGETDIHEFCSMLNNAPLDFVQKIIPGEDTGIVDLRGREAVAIIPYASHMGMDSNDLKNMVAHEMRRGEISVASTNAVFRGVRVPLYWKSDVDAIIAKYKTKYYFDDKNTDKNTAIVPLDPLDPQSELVEVVNLRFILRLGIAHKSATIATLKEDGLEPFTKVAVYENEKSTRPSVIFLRKELDLFLKDNPATVAAPYSHFSQTQKVVKIPEKKKEDYKDGEEVTKREAVNRIYVAEKLGLTLDSPDLFNAIRRFTRAHQIKSITHLVMYEHNESGVAMGRTRTFWKDDIDKALGIDTRTSALLSSPKESGETASKTAADTMTVSEFAKRNDMDQEICGAIAMKMWKKDFLKDKGLDTVLTRDKLILLQRRLLSKDGRKVLNDEDKTVLISLEEYLKISRDHNNKTGKNNGRPFYIKNRNVQAQIKDAMVTEKYYSRTTGKQVTMYKLGTLNFNLYGDSEELK